MSGLAGAEQMGAAAPRFGQFCTVAETASTNAAGCGLRLVKECAGGGRGVFLTEGFRLDAWQPLLEYCVRVENRRAQPVWMPDCDGLIGARFGALVAGQKRLCAGPYRRVPLTQTWHGVPEEPVPPADRTWVAVQAAGYSLGLVDLSPHAHLSVHAGRVLALPGRTERRAAGAARAGRGDGLGHRGARLQGR